MALYEIGIVGTFRLELNDDLDIEDDESVMAEIEKYASEDLIGFLNHLGIDYIDKVE